jgi:hypothetical protein
VFCRITLNKPPSARVLVLSVAAAIKKSLYRKTGSGEGSRTRGRKEGGGKRRKEAEKTQGIL